MNIHRTTISASASWCELMSKVNEIDLKILEHSIYIKQYKEKRAELDAKIVNKKREIKLINDHNEFLKPQLDNLKRDYEKNLNRIRLMLTIERQLGVATILKDEKAKQELAIIEKKMFERKEQFRALEMKYQIRTLEYDAYKSTKDELTRVDIELTILQARKQDEKEKQVLQRDIDRQLRNQTILEFAKKYVSFKNNEHLLKEIKEKTALCDKLMQLYQTKLLDTDQTRIKLANRHKPTKRILEIPKMESAPKRKDTYFSWTGKILPEYEPEKLPEYTPVILPEYELQKLPEPQHLLASNEVITETINTQAMVENEETAEPLKNVTLKIRKEKPIVDVLQQHIIEPYKKPVVIGDKQKMSENFNQLPFDENMDQDIELSYPPGLLSPLNEGLEDAEREWREPDFGDHQDLSTGSLFTGFNI